MEIKLEKIGNTLKVLLGQEVDHHVATQVKEQIGNQIQCGKTKHIIFDFSHTTFMDSSGIGMIMGRYQEVNRLGGKIYVTGIGNEINRILELSGLYKIVTNLDKA